MHVYYSDIISSCSNNLTRAFIQPPSVQQKKNQADCLSRTRDMTSVSFSDRVSRSRELLYQIWACGINRASLSVRFRRTVLKRFVEILLSEISPTPPFRRVASAKSVHVV